MDDWTMVYKGVGTGLVCLGHAFANLTGETGILGDLWVEAGLGGIVMFFRWLKIMTFSCASGSRGEKSSVGREW